jgi:hypothetical protein
LSTARLKYLFEKVENTDAMNYTKKGLNTIIKVVLGRNEAAATCPGKAGTP